MRLLLVDDEPGALRHLVQLVNLATQVPSIDTAENGREALAKLGMTPFDAIITDMNMPVMNGIELSRQVQQNYPQVCVAVVSGHSEFVYLQGAIQTGVVDYLLKPVSLAQLNALLDKFVTKVQRDNQPSNAQTVLEGIHTTKIDSQPFYQAMYDYLQGHLAEPITLASLCQTFGISPSYGNKLFRKYGTLNFTDSLTQLRMARAKELLASHPHLSMSAVSQAVGYSDPLYFSKVFRKATGKPPSRWIQ